VGTELGVADGTLLGKALGNIEGALDLMGLGVGLPLSVGCRVVGLADGMEVSPKAHRFTVKPETTQSTVE